jgi:hypothetical protein
MGKRLAFMEGNKTLSMGPLAFRYAVRLAPRGQSRLRAVSAKEEKVQGNEKVAKVAKELQEAEKVQKVQEAPFDSRRQRKRVAVQRAVEQQTSEAVHQKKRQKKSNEPLPLTAPMNGVQRIIAETLMEGKSQGKTDGMDFDVIFKLAGPLVGGLRRRNGQPYGEPRKALQEALNNGARREIPLFERSSSLKRHWKLSEMAAPVAATLAPPTTGNNGVRGRLPAAKSKPAVAKRKALAKKPRRSTRRR